jgi:hypothetical protein
MGVSEIEVDPNLDGILAGAQFADAYRLTPIARPSKCQSGGGADVLVLAPLGRGPYELAKSSRAAIRIEGRSAGEE